MVASTARAEGKRTPSSLMPKMLKLNTCIHIKKGGFVFQRSGKLS